MPVCRACVKSDEFNVRSGNVMPGCIGPCVKSAQFDVRSGI